MAITFLDANGHYAAAEIGAKCWTVVKDTYATWEIAATASPAGQPMVKLGNLTGREDYYTSFRRAGPNGPTAYVGARFKLGSLNAYARGVPLFEFRSAGWLCVIVSVTQGGAIAVHRAAWNGSYGWSGFNGAALGAATLLGTSASAPIIAGNFYYIEARCTLSDDAGVVEVWVNGVSVLAISGVQTTVYHMIGGAGGCSGLIDVVGFGGVQPADTFMYMGEFYCATAEVGDVRIDTHFPDANGTDRDWTLSGGTDEYALLDEAAANTSDYIESSTIGDQTSVSLEALRNSGGTIEAVQLVGYLTKQEAGPCCVTPYVLIGGTRYYGSGWYPSWGSWRFFMHVWNTNPATGLAWTESTFNSAEFGVERTA